MDESQNEAQANPGWALAQLARAQQALAAQQAGSTGMARLQDRVAAWRQALAGMAAGTIHVGWRAPLRGVVPWVTPEVLHGGFASGGLAAGGRARAHERRWLQQLEQGQPLGTSLDDCLQIAALDEQPMDRSQLPEKVDRSAINDGFLSEAGFAQLLRWLDDGRWRIAVPEEGALLTVAWLVREGYADSAVRLLDEMKPYWQRLRFYPMPAATPMAALDSASLISAQALMAQLMALDTPPRLLAQHEAIHVWRPLFDALIVLWLEAVPGSPAEGPRLRTGTREAEGGLPAPMPDAAWRERARGWHAHWRDVHARHTRCGAHGKPGSPFAQMRRLLESVLAGQALAERECRQLRFLLACQIDAHGAPGSALHQAWRARQTEQTRTAWRAHWAAALARRVRAQGPFGEGDGLPDLDGLLHAATAQEAAQHAHLPAGTPVWPGLRRRLRRAWQAGVPQLVGEGLVPSSEVLARLLPATTASQWGQAMPDAAGARLLGALWRAFRRRRSLLLLNHASQVRFHELPWVARLLAHARMDVQADGPAGAPDMAAMDRANALAQLDAAARLALTQFPQSAFPNPLLWEFRALAGQGGWQQPWVEEIAADIFMGRFAPKHGQAIADALPWLAGSLYARHFRIELDALREAIAPAVAASQAAAAHRASEAGAPGASGASGNRGALKRASEAAFANWRQRPDALIAHLRARLNLAPGAAGIAVNGALIEQMGLVSTANFAPLAQRFGWDADAAGAETWQRAAVAAFQSLCASLSQPLAGADNAARLLAERVRRAAVTWRQVVLLASLLPRERQAAAIEAMRHHLGAQPEPLGRVLAPQLADLRACAMGEPRDAGLPAFCGWSAQGRHWAVEELST